jgi:hypothetical protein
MAKNAAPLVGPGVQYAVTTTALQYLDRNDARSWLAISNPTGGGIVYVGFGVAPTAATGYPIPAGTVWNPIDPPADQIWLLASTGTIEVTVIGK